MLRQFYDDLRRGEIVVFGKNHNRSSHQLRDFYGMEIVPAKTERGQILGSRLLGEWIGSEYIPVERLTVSLMETA